MISKGAVRQAGGISINEKNLPMVYTTFFEEMLDLFLTYSCRTVILFNEPF